jgi:hypothetical protein
MVTKLVIVGMLHELWVVRNAKELLVGRVTRGDIFA